MREQALGALPVTNETGQLVGVLTEHDLLVRLVPHRPAAWWSTLLNDKDRLAADYTKAVGVTVGEIMTTPPVTIALDASVEMAAALMARDAIGALPVVDHETCVGLVTRGDVIDHLAWPTTAAAGMVTDTELERAMHESIQRELWA